MTAVTEEIEGIEEIGIEIETAIATEEDPGRRRPTTEARAAGTMMPIPQAATIAIGSVKNAMVGTDVETASGIATAARQDGTLEETMIEALPVETEIPTMTGVVEDGTGAMTLAAETRRAGAPHHPRRRGSRRQT